MRVPRKKRMIKILHMEKKGEEGMGGNEEGFTGGEV